MGVDVRIETQPDVTFSSEEIVFVRIEGLGAIKDMALKQEFVEPPAALRAGHCRLKKVNAVELSLLSGFLCPADLLSVCGVIQSDHHNYEDNVYVGQTKL